MTVGVRSDRLWPWGDWNKSSRYVVAYFTASCDSVETNTRFAKSLKLDYPILSDPDGKVATAYGILNAKFGFAARKTFYIGENGRILYIDEEVKPAKHGSDVAKRLEALGITKNTN